jgi:hypothetical protein
MVRPKTPRTAIQALSVDMGDEESRDFDAWMTRVSLAGGLPETFLGYASWYGAVRDRWFDAAEAEGLWEPGRNPGHLAKGYCQQEADVLGHAERADGLVVHFLVNTEVEPRQFRAKVCREPAPFKHVTRWTDKQRLTWKEFTTGRTAAVAAEASWALRNGSQ